MAHQNYVDLVNMVVFLSYRASADVQGESFFLVLDHKHCLVRKKEQKLVKTYYEMANSVNIPPWKWSEVHNFQRARHARQYVL